MNCNCEDVKMGSYGNQITVEIPSHMASYKDKRLAAGLSGLICIDRCIAPELQLLWDKGIHTYGCCCGHNIEGVDSMINVREEDMHEALSLGLFKKAPHVKNMWEHTLVVKRLMSTEHDPIVI